MTDWRPAPIRQVEIDRDNDEKEGKAENEPASIIAVPEPFPEAKTQPRSFAGKIRDLFRVAMKVLTGKSPSPKPKRHRKREEDTRGLFKRLAMKIVAPMMRPIINLDDFAWFTPPDEPDETQRWLMRQADEQPAWKQCDADAYNHNHQNHLFPRL